MSIRSIRKVLAVAWDTAADRCTVQASTPGSIPQGTVARYSGPVFANVSSSRVVLVTPNGATASGHCTLSPTGLGTCRFSRGTGWLAGFHASLEVTTSSDGVLNWDGTYYFEPAV
jgi:hypothetical protein